MRTVSRLRGSVSASLVKKLERNNQAGISLDSIELLFECSLLHDERVIRSG